MTKKRKERSARSKRSIPWPDSLQCLKVRTPESPVTLQRLPRGLLALTTGATALRVRSPQTDVRFVLRAPWPVDVHACFGYNCPGDSIGEEP